MTESRIRSNITYNQNILDELYMEKSKIESQLYELDLLRDKVSGLQQRFGDRQQHRQTMLQRITHSTIQNKILKTYYDGMKVLLSGTEFNSAYEGLSESKCKINREVEVLQESLGRCVDNIAYRKERCDYWRSQLASLLAEEGR